MNSWAVGLSTGCFYQIPILRVLEAIRGAGFSLVEVCSFPAHLDYHDSEAVTAAARRLQELSLEPVSFHAPFANHLDITSPEADEREQALREIMRAAEAAAALQAHFLVIHPGPEKGGFPRSDWLPRIENAAAVLERVARRCRELGLKLALENMLPHLFSGHVRELLWILGALQNTDVGVCLDTGHAFLSGDLPTVVHKLSGHLCLLHASDNRGQFDDHLPPGDGRIPWANLIRQLSSTGFRGPFILEIAAAGSINEVTKAAQRGLTHLYRAFRQIVLDATDP